MVVKYIGILVNARWHAMLGGYRAASPGRKASTVILGILFAVLIIFNFFFAFTVANIPSLLGSADFSPSTLTSSANISDLSQLVNRILALILLLAFTVLLFSGFSTALSSLYLSNDMDMLLSAPVPMRAVFVVKLSLGLGIAYILLLGFGLPYILGMGIGLGYNVVYYPVAILGLLILPLIPTGLSAIGVIWLVRILPPGRIRDILAVVGALFSVLFYLLSQLPGLLANNSNRGALSGTGQTISRFALSDTPWLPSTWAARAMEAAGKGDWRGLAAWGILYFGLSLLVFIGCLEIAERAYYGGWANIASVGGRNRRSLERERTARKLAHPDQPQNGSPSERLVAVVTAAPKQERAGGLLSGGTQAVVDKDFTALRRDPTGFSQLLWPIAVAVVLLLNLTSFGSRSGSSGADFGQFSQFTRRAADLSFIWPVAITVFASAAICAYFGLAAISRERRSIWMLKMAPVSWWEVLGGKFIIAYVPLAAFGLLISVVYGLLTGLTPALIAASVALSLFTNLGVTGVCIGLGGMLPNFTADNPQRQTSTAAGCLFFPILILYILLTVGSVAGGVLLGNGSFGLPLILGLLLSVVITGLAAWLPLKMAVDSLERLEL